MSLRLRFMLPLVWMAVIWSLSSMPSTAFGDLHSELAQNGAHVFVYALLAATWYWALAPAVTAVLPPFVWSFAFTIAYGLVDELHQGFVSGRTSSPWDLAADAIGAAIMLTAIAVRRRLGLPVTIVDRS